MKEVEASVHESSLVLIKSLPGFLGKVVEALSTTIDRTETKVKWDRAENKRINKMHGKERAKSHNYTMDQLIFEYHILRQVMCSIMEKEAPLSEIEREIIICSVEQAVNDAATEFCKDVNEITIKLAHEEELLSSIQTRDEFLTVVSHELKTPLTSLMLQAQMLLRNEESTEAEKQIKKVYSFANQVNIKIRRISHLVEDILDFGRIRTGSYKPDMSKINICEIINEVIDSLDLVFQAFKLGPPEFFSHEDSIVRIDKPGFEKVFRSLFTNAIKYGQGKPVSIQVKVKDSEVEVVVTDHGIGIEPGNVERIFKKFERAISPNEVCGLGLGLYLAKEIITAHGGHMWVESKLGEGSAFHFTIPRLLEDSKEQIETKSVTVQSGAVNNSSEDMMKLHH